MPRKRTSQSPPKERARLESHREINLEIKKLYRRFSNGGISPAALARRVETLKVLRSGLPDPSEIEAFGPGIIANVLPIASGTHLSHDACLHLTETGRLPPGAVINLIDPNAHQESTPMTVAAAIDIINNDIVAPICQPDNVVSFDGDDDATPAA